MPEDDFGIKLKASKKLKKIEMFFLTLCLLSIIRLRFPTGKSIAEIYCYNNTYCNGNRTFKLSIDNK